MADATAGALTPETMERLATASATGRMLLAMIAGWANSEAGPAIEAVNRDLRGVSDRRANAAARTLARRGGPEALADAMVNVLDALGRTQGITGDEWQRVRRLAGNWLPVRGARR